MVNVTVTDQFSACCPVLVEVPYPPAEQQVYKAASQITSDGRVRNDDGTTDIRFEAGQEIILPSGFEVDLGSRFEALISPCVWPE